MNKIYILWGFIMVLAFAGLTLFGYKYLEVKDYKDFEKSLENASKKYMKEHNGEYPEKEEMLYLMDTDLIEYQSEDILIKNDACTGFVVVHNGTIGYKYDAYIKCNSYSTNNYENMQKIS